LVGNIPEKEWNVKKGRTSGKYMSTGPVSQGGKPRSKGGLAAPETGVSAILVGGRGSERLKKMETPHKRGRNTRRLISGRYKRGGRETHCG